MRACPCDTMCGASQPCEELPGRPPGHGPQTPQHSTAVIVPQATGLQGVGHMHMAGTPASTTELHWGRALRGPGWPWPRGGHQEAWLQRQTFVSRILVAVCPRPRCWQGWSLQASRPGWQDPQREGAHPSALPTGPPPPASVPGGAAWPRPDPAWVPQGPVPGGSRATPRSEPAGL